MFKHKKVKEGFSIPYELTEKRLTQPYPQSN